MAYTIIRSDGNVLTTIADNIIDSTSTSLSLPGRNFAGYGQPVDTNWVRMLENFASVTVPLNPIRGQIWFNIANSTAPKVNVCPTDGETNALNWLTLISTDVNGNVLLDPGNINVPNGNVSANNLVASNLVQGQFGIIYGATDSTSTTTGALRITGGVGIGKSVHIGGNLYVEGDITYFNVTDIQVEDPMIVLGGGPNGAPLTTNDGKDRGSLLQYYTTTPVSAFMGWDNSGGEFIMGADVTNASDIVTVNTYGNLRIRTLNAVSNINAGGDATITGNIVGIATTGSSSTTTGALITAGGAGIAGNAYIGGNANVNGAIRGSATTDATSTTTGALITAGGAGIAGNAYIGGNANVTGAIRGSATTAATSTTTGALITAGGAGIAGNAYIGGNANVTGTANIGGDANVAGNLSLTGWSNIAGQANISNVDNATALGTGAITTAGGGSFAKDVWIGGNIYANFVAPGANRQVIYNDTGLLNGSPDFLFDESTKNVTITGSYISTVAVGTPPLQVTSTTRVANLYVEGANLANIQPTTAAGTYYLNFTSATSGNMLVRADTTFTVDPATGNLNASNVNANLYGNLNLAGTTGELVWINGGILDNAAGFSYNGTDTITTTGNLDAGNFNGGWFNGTHSAPGVNGQLLYRSGGNIAAITGVTSNGAGNLQLTDTISAATMITDDLQAQGGTATITGTWTLAVGASLAATYADLAERFSSDEHYDAGTVVEMGGTHEITAATGDASENILGVVSSTAAYLMNSGAGNSVTHPPIAMAGRVPVKIVGSVRKGDRLVSAGNPPGYARAARPGEATPFNTVGRALENKTSTGQGVVLAAVQAKL